MNESLPFTRGFNFSGWFETKSISSISFSRFTRDDFAMAKSLGADVIRLPIPFHSMTNGPPHYIIDPTLFILLDIVVDWVESLQIYLLIDNHSFNPSVGTPSDISSILLPVWTQIASRYRSRSDFIVYELLNEPHEISDAHWGEIQARTIDAIRKVDDRHWIVVGGSQWNSIGGLQKLPIYPHPKLFYTFHFYDPMLFTHQGATWVRPSLQPLANIPFPADSGQLPTCPPSLANTWIESDFKRYRETANPRNLERPFDLIVKFANERKVPVFCGEFGVFKTNCKRDDRIRWYQLITEFMDRRRIPRISWDYQDGFGVFEDDQRTQFNADLLRAMKFTPRQIDSKPITFDRFTFHADFFPKGVRAGTWDQEAVLDFYDTEVPVSRFGIRWGNASRYGAFWIVFPEPFDFTKQVREHSVLQFLARTRDKVNIEVRFVNPLPIPWRMRFAIDSKCLPPDGEWHLIRIPLAMMQDVGAWVHSEQKWVGSQGKFSWANVAKLEFVPENEDLKGKSIQFDSIIFSKITSC